MQIMKICLFLQSKQCTKHAIFLRSKKLWQRLRNVYDKNLDFLAQHPTPWIDLPWTWTEARFLGTMKTNWIFSDFNLTINYILTPLRGIPPPSFRKLSRAHWTEFHTVIKIASVVYLMQVGTGVCAYFSTTLGWDGQSALSFQLNLIHLWLHVLVHLNTGFYPV